MSEQRNLVLAIVLSVAILFGFQWLLPTSKPPAPLPAAPSTPVPQPQHTLPDGSPAPAAVSPSGAAPAATPATAPTALTREEALATSPRLPIQTDKVSGSIALKGGRIDDLTLRGYHQTVNPDSPYITLLSPSAAPHPYFAQSGWVAAAGNPVTLPGDDALWTPVDGTELTANGQVTLAWDNGQGQRFLRTIALDENYMFTITDAVENNGGQALTLYPYALLKRVGTPHLEGFYILHEGPLGVLNGSLTEYSYEDLRKDGEKREKTLGGWLGLTDKYWLAAVIPDQNSEVTAHFLAHRDGTREAYQTDFTGGAVTVAPGAKGQAMARVFAGAKVVGLLDNYEDTLGIKRFDLAIDFGWFYFITKPFAIALHWLYTMLGNMGVAILVLTVLIKLALFPLANKSYVSMSKMKKLQPEMKRLQERFKDDKMRLQQEMMALYKKEKVNPASGCLPILIQIPIFFALYKVLFVDIDMRHAPFFGWIHDLSAPDPMLVFNLFGLIPWTPPHFLQIGIWPVVMGLTMWAQQKLNPQPTDPVQARIMSFLPIIFTFLLGTFASGLVIYWAWSNTLSILQQWYILRKVEKES